MIAKRLTLPLSVLAAAVMQSPSTLAQDATMLEEVVVTAQRREQNLQDVPISVSAFSGGVIDQRNIKSAIDYLALTPNVSFTEDGQTGSRGLGIAIRGINNLVSGENAFVNSVGIYLDEFSVASVPNQVANPLLPDMERVEVLRGPQGTFFGRNAVAGALNLTTKKPTDTMEGEVKAGFESYEDAGEMYTLSGMINIPVSDSFALRAVGYYEDSDGYVENDCAAGASGCKSAPANGFTPNGAADSGHEYSMLRVHALWNVSDRTTVLATVVATDEEQGTDENVPSGVLDLDSIDTFGITSALDPGVGFWPNNQNKLSHDLPEATDNQSTVAILNIEHQLSDNSRIKWITGMIDAELDRLFDNDLAGGADTLKRTNHYEGKSWSTELRYEMETDRYDLVVGGMYASDEQTQENNVATSTQATATVDGVGWLPPFPAGLGLALNSKEWTVDSMAVFADLTWHMSDRLDLIVGGRYTKDDVENTLRAFGIAPFVNDCGDFWCSFGNLPRPEVNADESFSDFAPRVVARYQLNDDVNIYGSISKGYKAGGNSVGNNTNADGQPGFSVPFNEEVVWNYEIGFKSQLMGDRVRLNGSLFFLDWEDMQLEAFRFLTPGDLSSNFEQTVNVDSAEATGVELELLAALTQRLTLSAGLGYLDTEMSNNELVQITGGFNVDVDGLEIPKAPELTFNAALEYRVPVNGREFWFQLEVISRDGQFSDVESLTYQQTDGASPNSGLARNSIGTYGDFPFRTPDYTVWNARIGVDADNWQVQAYFQNLNDEDYYTGTQENFGVSGFRLRPHPQVMGASVSYRF